MKILIVTASVGSGHEKAAKAVAQGISKFMPDSDVTMIDYMSSSTSLLNAAMKRIYLCMLRFVPYLYECIYNFTAGPKESGYLNALMAVCMSRTMKGLINRYDPEIIICTHPFPADAISHLSAKWRKRFLSALLITDYTVHPMCVCHNIDMFFVAHSAMKVSLYSQGIKEGTVFDAGIPVDMNFYDTVDREKIRQEYGLSMDKPVLLMMGGGLGLGGMEEAMQQLELVQSPLQVVVVAGRNQELFDRVKTKAETSRHYIVVLGFTDKIRDLMGAADILISKPGGMTLSEAMTMKLPMLLNQPIPGPETDNARYMSDHGIARWLRTDEPLSKAIEELIAEPETLENMRMAAERHRRLMAVEKIIKNIQLFLRKSNAK